MLRDDGMMDGHQLRPVRKRSFDLHLVDHVGDAVEDIGSAQQPATQIHQLGHRAAVADEFQELCRDERRGLDVIEAQAPRQALLRQHTRLVEDQLVDLARCQMHVSE